MLDHSSESGIQFRTRRSVHWGAYYELSAELPEMDCRTTILASEKNFSKVLRNHWLRTWEVFNLIFFLHQKKHLQKNYSWWSERPLITLPVVLELTSIFSICTCFPSMTLFKKSKLILAFFLHIVLQSTVKRNKMSVIFDNCTTTDSNLLESVQTAAARIILGCLKTTSHEIILKDLGLTPLFIRRQFHILKPFRAIIFGLCPLSIVPIYACSKIF